MLSNTPHQGLVQPPLEAIAQALLRCPCQNGARMNGAYAMGKFTISPKNLYALIGRPNSGNSGAPIILDVCKCEDYDIEPRLEHVTVAA